MNRNSESWSRLSFLLSSAAFCLIAACATRPVRPAPAAPAPVAPLEAHGLTLREEATILRLEDRREYDPAVVRQWISHPNSIHRERIALALGRIGTAAFIDSNGNGEKDEQEQQAGVAELASLVRDPNASVRRIAAFALGEIGDVRGVIALVQFARDRENADIATEAVEALSKIGGEKVFADYVRFAQPEVPEGIRAHAVRFLFRFRTDAASAIAGSLIDSPDAAIRKEAAYSLSRHAHPLARPKLELLLTDPDTLTRAFAARALGVIGDAQSIEPLLRSLRDPHPWVRTNATRAIGQLIEKTPTLTARPQASEDVLKLITIIEDPDPGTRATGIETLGYYAPASELAVRELAEIAINGSQWQRELSFGALSHHAPDKLPDVTTASGPIKRKVIETSSADQQGFVLRRKLWVADDPFLRASIIGAIPDNSVDREMSLIEQALADPDIIVRANAIDRLAQSKMARPQLLTRLRAADERARRDVDMNDARLAAVRAIASIDDSSREAYLRGLLHDSDLVIKRVASDLLVEKLDRNRPAFTPLPISRSLADYEEIARWSRERHTATIHMPRGKIELFLLTQEAPMTTRNFAALAQQGFFNNTSFMRVVPNFVIQGGDPRNDQNGGPGYAIRDEINLQRYTRGAVGAALSGPDTGASQFFITHSQQPHLDGGYTVFARVVDGMGGVVDQTERGDRVTTITIDEKDPTSTLDLSSPQSIPLPTEMGRTSPARLLEIVPEYQQRKTTYEPDPSAVQYLAAVIQPGHRVEVYLGTWCSDSLREVPKFLKMLDVLKSGYQVELPASYLAVNRAKNEPRELLEGKAIEKVATFIVFRNGAEIGRVVETPNGLLEDDLLQILNAGR